MTVGRRAIDALRAVRLRRTVRFRLTLWYGGLFFLSGAALLAITYALVVQAFTAGSGPMATCRSPGHGCHAVGAARERAAALQEHASVLQELLTRSVAALAVMAVLSIVLGWFIAGRVLRPLRTSFTAQRQFIANAAHELRTPLTRQRIISQVALADPDASVESLRAAHERVLASGTEQQQLIDALLALAQGQAGLDSTEPVDLAEVTRQVAVALRTDADHRNLSWHLTLDPAPTAGSPHLIRQLAANLVDNALRHNLPGGQVDITTQAVSSRAVLSVTNTGPAVPADALDRLFQPFQRHGADRASRAEGFGLGLTIVQAIADAHRASLTVRPGPEGGLQVQVTFPGCPPDQAAP